MPSKRSKQRSFRRQIVVPVLSDIEEDASTVSTQTSQSEHDSHEFNINNNKSKYSNEVDLNYLIVTENIENNDVEHEFPVFCVDNGDLTMNEEIIQCSDYEYDHRNDDIELGETYFDYSQFGKIYSDYRQECQRLLSRKDSDKDQNYIKQLEQTVQQLLEQNEVLVDNLHTVTIESEMRVKELRNRLHNSAKRTEETMLALSSHELYLKSFSQKHCCACCACDTRLMATRLCHGGLCEFDESFENNKNNKQCTLDAARSGYFRSIHNSDHWYSSIRPSAIEAHRLECIQNLPSQVRFSTLVDRLQRQNHSLEDENRELKHENALIRQLNSYLCGRDFSTTISSRVLDQNRNPMSVHVNKFHHEDYDEFIHRSTSVASFSPPASDGCDSCPISRPESLAEGRADNDSGCSTTDLIPSTTDIASLLFSDCDDDCLSDPPEMTKILENIQSNRQQATSKKLSNAEKLVPKLFQQLIYYVAQRNILVKQFKNENDARQQCKAEIASLADCLSLELANMQHQQISKQTSIDAELPQ